MTFFGNKKQLNPAPTVLEPDHEPLANRSDDYYSDLIARRPGLLEERLKLHALIIDEFNLAALDKLPPDELSRQVRTYVGNYARDGSLPFNKKLFFGGVGPTQETKIHFKDEAHLLRIVNKIVSAVGRRVDESSPMVDARLPDGSRVNVAVRPVAVDGPLISIRKFSERVFNMERLVAGGA